MVPADTDAFQIDLDQVERRLTPLTQAIIINSPTTLRRGVYPPDAGGPGPAAGAQEGGVRPPHLHHRRRAVPGAGIRRRGGALHPHGVPQHHRVLPYSKSLSLPGERIGYICVPDSVEDHQAVYSAIAGAARSCGHVCPPTLIQLTIARCADELPDLAAYDENRQLLYRGAHRHGLSVCQARRGLLSVCQGPGGDDVAFCERAKREHNLLVVPGTGFECPGYVRLSYCVSNDMIRRSLPAFRELIAAYQS